MQRFDLIVRGGMAVLADEVKRLDIGIIGGRIAELSERIDGESDRLIDASQLHIMPGMIDVHVHFNEPGLGEWEGFYHGSSSMAAGGCTTYFDMPLNGVPPTIRISALQQKLEAAKGQSFVDYALWGGLVPRNRDDLAALAQSGIIGFKAFMSSPSPSEEDEFREADDLTLYEGMQEIAKQHKILALHAESEAITGRLAERCKRLGLHSAADYIASRPVIAEMEAVQRALFFAEQTGCALHFVHISSARSVELIDAAKQRGIDVTLETCPHYLALTADDLDTLGGLAKCSPPLRTRQEQEQLWEALREGKIDMISSDHSPCPRSMKENADGNFFALWGGISGGQSSMEIIIDEAHIKRGIPLQRVAQWLSANPAKRFGLHPQKGGIALHADADLALVALDRTYVLRESDLYYRHPHSPYVGRRMGCRIEATISRGRLVYENGRGLQGDPDGHWVSVQ